MLFSDHACSDITKHIAKTMMSDFVKYVNDSEHQFSVLVDESTTVSSIFLYCNSTVFEKNNRKLRAEFVWTNKLSFGRPT